MILFSVAPAGSWRCWRTGRANPAGSQLLRSPVLHRRPCAVHWQRGTWVGSQGRPPHIPHKAAGTLRTSPHALAPPSQAWDAPRPALCSGPTMPKSGSEAMMAQPALCSEPRAGLSQVCATVLGSRCPALARTPRLAAGRSQLRGASRRAHEHACARQATALGAGRPCEDEHTAFRRSSQSDVPCTGELPLSHLGECFYYRSPPLASKVARGGGVQSRTYPPWLPTPPWPTPPWQLFL